MKKEKNATKEAFDGTAFAQFFSGPGGRQAGAVLAVLGIVGHDGDCPKHSMNPGNQTQAPIGGIQADDPRTDVIELLGPCQQGLCKGGIVWIGRRKQKEERKSRTTTDEGMHSEASQQGKRMVSGSVSVGGIRVTHVSKPEWEHCQ